MVRSNAGRQRKGSRQCGRVRQAGTQGGRYGNTGSGQGKAGMEINACRVVQAGGVGEARPHGKAGT
jgi:hypothetical protein